MIIGYVHVGAPEHGVSRYGRLLAAEARNRRELHVIECEIELTGEPKIDRRRAADAGRQLSGVDVIHLQYNNQLTGSVWGPRWRQLLHLRAFARAARAPVVATLHDVYAMPRTRWLSRLRHPWKEFRRTRRVAPQVTTLRWLQHRASRVLVCSEEERARLGRRVDPVRVIPHFVEVRDSLSARDAKEALGLAGKRVVTLLGYIHRRKGHDLLVDALAALPEDVIAIFAGTSPKPDSPFVRELLAHIRAAGVGHRVRITGFLPDDQLDRYLAATDLGVCPFSTLSASGSLSTWISVLRPIVANDLPQIAEYNALQPGAIRTFRPYTAPALAEALGAALEAGTQDVADALVRLRARLLLPSVFDRHLEAYRELSPQARALTGKPERKWVSVR